MCYLREPPFTPFQPIVVQKLLGLLLRTLYYVVQLIYTTSQAKFERNSPRSLLVSRTWNLWFYSSFSSNSLHQMHSPRKGECILSSRAWISQGGVVHIYTVARSATAVKLKVNGQFEIFSKINGQATTFLWCFEPNQSWVKQNFSDKTRMSLIDAMLQ